MSKTRHGKVQMGMHSRSQFVWTRHSWNDEVPCSTYLTSSCPGAARDHLHSLSAAAMISATVSVSLCIQLLHQRAAAFPMQGIFWVSLQLMRESLPTASLCLGGFINSEEITLVFLRLEKKIFWNVIAFQNLNKGVINKTEINFCLVCFLPTCLAWKEKYSAVILIALQGQIIYIWGMV